MASKKGRMKKKAGEFSKRFKDQEYSPEAWESFKETHVEIRSGFSEFGKKLAFETGFKESGFAKLLCPVYANLYRADLMTR